MATDSEISLKINVESTFAKGFEAESKRVISTLQQIASKGISTFDQLSTAVSTKTASAFSVLSGISSVGTVPTGGADEVEYRMAA